MTNPGMGPATHKSSEPLPKPAIPKAGTSAMTVEARKDLIAQAKSTVKAAFKAASIPTDDESFFFDRPKPIAPLIPFTGIGEEAFFETYECKDEALLVPDGARMSAR